MSHFHATAASNTFRVRDRGRFERALDGLAIIVETCDGAGDPRDVLIRSSDAHGRWPTERLDHDSHDCIPVDLLALVIEHLEPGHVAVLAEADAEEHQHIAATAWAVNAHGERREVNLDDIFDRAAALGDQLLADV